MRSVTRDMRFSQAEIVDLIKAWLATAIAFAIYFSAGKLSETTFAGFIILIAIAAVTAGIGFLLHELMHKYAAHRFGVHSEFHSNDGMLVFMILLSFFGIIFAAPGAVYILGGVTRKENGIISLAGPATNMGLALLFLPLVLASNPILAAVGSYGMFINAFLGAFNLIPFFGLDGQKVLAWHKGWYFASLIVAGILVVAAFVLVSGV